MIRKWFSLLTALALCLSLLPGSALADGEEFTVKIGGTTLTGSPENHGKYVPKGVEEGGGVKTWTDEDNYLEFNGNTLTVHGTLDVYGGMKVTGGELTIMVASAFTLYAGDASCALTINSGSTVILDGKENLKIEGVTGDGTLKTEGIYEGMITLQSPSANKPAVSDTSLNLTSNKTVMIYNSDRSSNAGVEVFDNASGHIDAGTVLIVGTVPDDWSKLYIEAKIGYLVVNSTNSIIDDENHQLWAVGEIKNGVIDLDLETVKIPTRYEAEDEGVKLYYTPEMGDNPATLTGTGTLRAEGKVQALTIGDGVTLTVPAGKTLEITDSNNFKNDGTIQNEGTIKLEGNAANAENISQAIKNLGLEGEGSVKVQTAEGNELTYTNSGTAVVTGNLTFKKDEKASGAGYEWKPTEIKNDEGNITYTSPCTLTLTNVDIRGTVTLPDKGVTINVTGDCGINALEFGSGDSTYLTVAGTGKLTVNERINNCGGNDPSLTVESGAELVAKDGIAVSTGGSVNGTITINGTLTAIDIDKDWNAVSTGKVIVNGGGTLDVSGKPGVFLGGMKVCDEDGNPTGATNYTGAFILETGGTFTADCAGNAIEVSDTLAIPAKELPEGLTPETVIVIPPGYVTKEHEPKWGDDGHTSIIIEGGEFTISSANIPQPPTPPAPDVPTPPTPPAPVVTRYTITVNAGEHGTITGSASHRSAAAGTRVSLTGVTAEPEEGYRFTGWTSDEVTVAGDGTFTMPGRNVTITAGWEEEVPEPGPDDPGPGPDVPEPDVPAPSRGRGSGSSSAGVSGYPITVKTPEHGSVTASKTSASANSTVTLTVSPDRGYGLDTLTVTDSRGNELKLIAQSGSRYIFTMPGKPVTVKAAFAPVSGDAARDADRTCDGGADCPSRSFADLGTAGTWYHEAVDYVLRNGLMSGYGNGTFRPGSNLTRAQFAQILYNKEGRPAVTGSSIFADVAEGLWCAPAVTWAAANGIVGGYGNDTFRPNGNITREQLAAMLWRYAGSPAATDQELHFSDADQASGYAREALRWAVESGIINGYSDGRLNPGGLATRAQAAQMLQNYLEK